MIASAFPLVISIGALIVLAATGNLFSPSPIAIAAQVAAVALNIWARISFKKGTFRITAEPEGVSILKVGPYRFIRHPMYAALLLFVWAGIASHLSVFTISITTGITAVCVCRIIVEERLLRARYPEYVAYARATKRLIPFVI